MDYIAAEKQLDSEIARIRAEITSLRTRKQHLTRCILSSRSTAALLKSARPTPARATALQAVDKQTKRNTYQLYQYCAGTTAFRVRDPDPHAVDNGKVLGVRIDVDVRGRFVEPYYLFLHKTGDGENLKLHKHTIPVHIPLNSLAAKYLPEGRPQRLDKLVKELRREIAAWHKRIAVLNALRGEIGLGPAKTRDDEDDPMSEDESVEGENEYVKIGIKDIASVDVPVREVQISWHDGSIARLNLNKDGSIVKAVTRNLTTQGGYQKKRNLERAIAGGDGHFEGVVSRLRATE